MKLYLRITHRALKVFQGTASSCLSYFFVASLLSAQDYLAVRNTQACLRTLLILAGVLVGMSAFEALGDTAWQLAYEEWQVRSTLQNNSSKESEDFLKRMSTTVASVGWQIVGVAVAALCAYGWAVVGVNHWIIIGTVLTIWGAVSFSLSVCAYRLHSPDTTYEHFKEICEREKCQRIN